MIKNKGIVIKEKKLKNRKSNNLNIKRAPSGEGMGSEYKHISKQIKSAVSNKDMNKLKYCREKITNNIDKFSDYELEKLRSELNKAMRWVAYEAEAYQDTRPGNFVKKHVKKINKGNVDRDQLLNDIISKSPGLSNNDINYLFEFLNKKEEALRKKKVLGSKAVVKLKNIISNSQLEDFSSLRLLIRVFADEGKITEEQYEILNKFLLEREAEKERHRKRVESKSVGDMNKPPNVSKDLLKKYSSKKYEKPSIGKLIRRKDSGVSTRREKKKIPAAYKEAGDWFERTEKENERARKKLLDLQRNEYDQALKDTGKFFEQTEKKLEKEKALEQSGKFFDMTEKKIESQRKKDEEKDKKTTNREKPSGGKCPKCGSHNLRYDADGKIACNSCGFIGSGYDFYPDKKGLEGTSVGILHSSITPIVTSLVLGLLVSLVLGPYTNQLGATLIGVGIIFFGLSKI